MIRLLEALTAFGGVSVTLWGIYRVIAPVRREERVRTVPATSLRRGDKLVWTRGRVGTVVDQPRPDPAGGDALAVDTVELGTLLLTEPDVDVLIPNPLDTSRRIG